MSEATEIASMGITTMIELMQARDEIKRLKEALDKQQVKDEPAPVAKNEGGRITWMIDDWPQNCLLYTHLPKQEAKDEPMAWSEEIIDDLHALYDSEMIKENDSGDALIRLDEAVCVVEEVAQRNTTPPQRKPLSKAEAAITAYRGYDEYWTKDCNGSETEAWIACARAIEAAHGIKGEA